MELIIYGGCRIEFTGKRRSEDVISERALIELYKTDNTGYLLRGVDIQNAKKIIFDIQLTENNLYKFGSSANYSDEIRGEDGTYRLWLNNQSRDAFHKELRKILAQPVSPKRNLSNINLEKSQANKSRQISKKIDDQNNILIDIHNLDEHIENGNIKEAADLASKLASKHVQLKTTMLDSKLNDEKIRIQVKIDSTEYPTNEPQILNVYKSTTIRELRAAFEHTHGFPSSTQYFFINGNLVDENASINDLNIHLDSIFVLFLISQRNDRI